MHGSYGSIYDCVDLPDYRGALRQKEEQKAREAFDNVQGLEASEPASRT